MRAKNLMSAFPLSSPPGRGEAMCATASRNLGATTARPLDSRHLGRKDQKLTSRYFYMFSLCFVFFLNSCIGFMLLSDAWMWWLG